MKKVLCVIVVALFVHGVAGTGVYAQESRFNIFENRRIVIGDFKNLGDPLYKYVNTIIRTTLYTMTESIPFITITEIEQTVLQKKSELEQYKGAFIQAGSKIPNRMQTAVSMDAPVGEEFPLVLFGNYEVRTPETSSGHEMLSISIEERNMLTGQNTHVYETQTTLEEFLKNPEAILSDFFRYLLPYKTYIAELSVHPPDALIFLDNRLLGTGTVTDLVVTPGNHRVTITKNGYDTFSDIVSFNKDPFHLHITLQKSMVHRKYTLYSVPAGADVYLDEEYLGKTPVTFEITGENQMLTLIREGYRTMVVNPDRHESNNGILKIVLERPNQWDRTVQLAERHKKRGKLLSYAGFGMIGLVILFGTEKTLNLQKADLYAGKDSTVYEDAVQKSRLYNTLLVSSSLLTLGIFTFSFVETLQYFNLYDRTDVPIIRGKVQF
jgi:hypothetical protein